MNETAYANENEIFSELMNEFVRSYGDALLQKNRELKGSANTVSALSHVRCRELIRREFAAVRRRGLVRSFRISAAVACAAMIVAAGTVLLVPGLHDAVLGRTESAPSVILSEEDRYRPSYRHNMPPVITPEPEEDTDYPITSKEYRERLDAYITEQLRLSIEEHMRQQEEEWAEQNRRTAAQNNIRYEIEPFTFGNSGKVNTYGIPIDGYYPDMTPPGPTSAINVQPNTGRHSDQSYHDLPPGTYVIGDKVVVKIFPD